MRYRSGKRRKIRCTFPSGNTSICNWCISHGSTCVSQRFQDETGDASRAQSMESRMMRVENLLEQVLEKLDSAGRQSRTEESPGRPTTIDDSTGIDVVNTTSNISAPSSSSAVVSVFQSASVGISSPFLLYYYSCGNSLLTSFSFFSSCQRLVERRRVLQMLQP